MGACSPLLLSHPATPPAVEALVGSDSSRPHDCITPGFLVLHHLLESAQVHVLCVGDAIQPSHLLPPPPPAINLSQHQSLFPMSQLFTSGGQSIGAGASASVSVLPMNIQD